jgi:carbon monoxide dehydrogenase subunit G
LDSPSLPHPAQLCNIRVNESLREDKPTIGSLRRVRRRALDAALPPCVLSYWQDITSPLVVIDMKFGSSFTVPAASTTVFDLFLDAPTMRACIPGCEELERTDETHFRGRLVNTIAHVRFNAAFTAEIVGLDAPHEVRAVLQGEDQRLGSSIKVQATLTVQPEGDGSLVTYAMELALWGKLGRLGESIVQRRTVEVERQFVEAFTRACTAGPVELPAPVSVGARGSEGAVSAPPSAPPAPVRSTPERRMSPLRRLVAWFRGRGAR